MDRSEAVDRNAPFNLAQSRAEALRLLREGRRASAGEFYRQILDHLPGDVESLHHLGLIAHMEGREEEAEELIGKAIGLKPDYVQALSNLSAVFRAQRRFEEAAEACRRAIALKPEYAEAHSNLGAALISMGRLAEAETELRRAIALKPGLADAHFNLGHVLSERERMEEAAVAFRRATELKPEFVDAFVALGSVLECLWRPEEAIAAFRKGMLLRPDQISARGMLCYLRRSVCDWNGLEEEEARVLELAMREGEFIPPHQFINMGASSEAELHNARLWTAKLDIDPALRLRQPGARPTPRAGGDERIRVGYLSADFSEHATAHLIAETLESHDRSRFLITAYSYGPPDRSPMRERLSRAVERFVDLRDLSHEEAARRIHADDVDILVDLKGHTRYARTQIMAWRPAPVQVHHVGYPGTMGAGFIDYIVGDRFVTPLSHQPFFDEKIVQLPHCYQPNDVQRPISETTPSRAECGLPESGLVFCCFNNTYKLSPAFFGAWMRLLSHNPGSVLWLLETNALVAANLRREAAVRGVDPSRLVFARRRALPDHLARHRLADLFLDTSPINAHTTASDALWAGLPVLTCMGRSFAGRVAASLLHAAGLPELVTHSLAEYEESARRLAADPALLQGLRGRLAGNRLASPLFDAPRYTRALEAAYVRMWETCRDGRPPEPFAVPEGGGEDAAKLSAAGLQRLQAGRRGEAADLFQRALAYDRDHAESLHHLGVIAHAQGRHGDAAALIEKAIARKPDYIQALSNLGAVYRAMGKLDAAASACRRALALNPGYAAAHCNLAVVLLSQGETGEAEVELRRAIELKPDYADAWFNLGKIISDQERKEEALNAFSKAVEFRPDFIEAQVSYGLALERVERLGEAGEALRRVIALKPDYVEAHVDLNHLLRRICDWRGLEESQPAVLEMAERQGAFLAPIQMLNVEPDPARQLRNARVYAATKDVDPASRLIRPGFRPAPKQGADKRIRVGYLSADFRNHATAYLTAELFERHDRSRFSIMAYSIGWDDGGDMRRRLTRAFDNFVDLRGLSDLEAARRIHDDGIDILVDLKGYTRESRVRIMALRPAPVQVNYIGYPGSMGTGFIDYIIGDRYVTPFDSQEFFDEKIVQLPHSYQPNDAHRIIADAPPPRAGCGLPERAFVFCCFNSGYKLSPQMFDIWMRLLKAVPGSVLWLLASNPLVPENLRREAQARGVDPGRLVFAPKRPLPDHLARHRLADLFLDTLPYNAHTTASDALWAGLPVLTCMGRAFASRVAGSLLHAVGLPELVAHTLEDYEALALRLAQEPGTLQTLRERLAANRLKAPLFDAERYAQGLEAAYARMWENCEAGRPPESFAVDEGQGLEGLWKRAVGSFERGRYAEAKELYRRILAGHPDHAQSLHHLGLIARAEGRLSAAVELIGRAITLDPGYVQACANLSIVLRDLGNLDEAERMCRRAVRLDRGGAEIHSNLGVILYDRGRFAEAAREHRCAIGLRPDFAQAYSNLGRALSRQGDLKEAGEVFSTAIRMQPESVGARTDLLRLSRMTCDWRGLYELQDRIWELAEKQGAFVAPVQMLNMESDPGRQLRNARRFAASIAVNPCERLTQPGFRPALKQGADGRIRVGYMSADFRNHAVAYLTAELFERHDRSRFSITGYSIDPDDGGEMRRRLERAFDDFVDLRGVSNPEAARRIQGDGVDILVDMQGYTRGARTRIMAHRPAPVQVNYIGYPGSMGAEFIDYIIGDGQVTPFESQPFFDEKIVQLPHCYQANDTRRTIAAATPSRSECGLPEKGFVFCCFNGANKLSPAMFGVWMRLLNAVPGSALWLLEPNRLVAPNLRREAEARGVDPERLVFAGELPLAEHLARHRLADLFLDTLPYNAHTTASDALWAGLPVLTCTGEAFASRVAGSLLRAAGLPELIVSSMEEYEAMAARLAKEPGLLRALRERLAANRTAAPLFDIERYTRGLEAAYVRMWETCAAGRPAEAFAVQAGG